MHVEPNLERAVVTLLPPQYRYNWPISSTKKRTQDRKLGTEKYGGRKLQLDIELLPDCMGSNNERLAKLKMVIKLGNVALKDLIYTAHISTTLYNPEETRVISQRAKSFKFEEDKNVLKFLMTLGKMELVERSRSKQLEIHVEVKVCGERMVAT